MSALPRQRREPGREHMELVEQLATTWPSVSTHMLPEGGCVLRAYMESPHPDEPEPPPAATWSLDRRGRVVARSGPDPRRTDIPAEVARLALLVGEHVAHHRLLTMAQKVELLDRVEAELVAAIGDAVVRTLEGVTA